MIYYTLSPPIELSTVVRAMWVLSGSFSESQFVPYRLFADGSPNLVFHYQNQFRELPAGGGKASVSPVSLLSGQCTTFTDLECKGQFGMIGFYLYPYATEMLFNMPSSEITNESRNLRDLLGAEGCELEDKVINAESDRYRLQIVCDFLSKRLRKGTEEKLAILASVNQILMQKGACNIDQLARYVNLSSRQLDRKFNQSVGLGPKLFSRIVRFRSTLKLLESGQKLSLTSLGYDAGYSDQSHFIREFKSFSGMTPKIYHHQLEDTADSFVKI